MPWIQHLARRSRPPDAGSPIVTERPGVRPSPACGAAEPAGLLTTDETETLVRAFEYIYGLLLDKEIAAMRAGDLTSTTVRAKDSTR